MQTPEQILEKHLSPLINRTDESYVSVDEMKQQPEWKATIDAMVEYRRLDTFPTRDIIQRFIQNERDQIKINKKYFLSKGGEYAFHNINTLHGNKINYLPIWKTIN